MFGLMSVETHEKEIAKERENVEFWRNLATTRGEKITELEAENNRLSGLLEMAVSSAQETDDESDSTELVALKKREREIDAEMSAWETKQSIRMIDRKVKRDNLERLRKLKKEIGEKISQESAKPTAQAAAVSVEKEVV